MYCSMLSGNLSEARAGTLKVKNRVTPSRSRNGAKLDAGNGRRNLVFGPNVWAKQLSLYRDSPRFVTVTAANLEALLVVVLAGKLSAYELAVSIPLATLYVPKYSRVMRRSGRLPRKVPGWRRASFAASRILCKAEDCVAAAATTALRGGEKRTAR